MIKIIIHITKFIVATITALLFTSCNFNMNAIEGSGNVTTEKRIVQGDFTNVKVSQAIDLVLIQSDSTEIVVEADDNLQKEIETKVDNGTLIIRCKFNSFRNIKAKRVTVKMPVINHIEASSASSVTNRNVIHGQDIELETSSAATMDVNIESDNIAATSSSGSSINIEGKALKTSFKGSSGSSVNAGKLFANDIEADVSSGATMEVHPILSLKAGASSGGTINYNNAPKSIEKRASSGGSINQQ